MSESLPTSSSTVLASGGGPRAAYTKRLFELAEDAARCKKKDDAYGWMKLLLLAAAVAVGVVAVVYHTIPLWTVLVPVLLFGYFAVVHERALREVRRVSRARAFYE